jgi:hypothetical protein
MSQAVNIPLTKKEVLGCLEQALQQNFIDNLRHRHPNVALDSKLRGYVGELAFRKWMNQNGVEFSNSNIPDKSSGMDIDFIFETPTKELEIELKTSMLPDSDETIACAMQRRDIKLIKRGNQGIEDLKSDIHVQIIFKQLRIRKDEWLKKRNTIKTIYTIESKKNELENAFQELAAFRYETDTFLVGWIDKLTLIKQIRNKPKRIQKWKYGMREFWTCNLTKEAKRPIELVEYLKAISE